MEVIQINSFVDHFKSLKVSNNHQARCNNKFPRYDPAAIGFKKNDIYVIVRKEALEMERSADEHFKLAKEAYIQGAHSCAKHHSTKAREEKERARELHSKAAIEILKFMNRKNNVWRIDLHGLRAAEAVQALQERLEQIQKEGCELLHSSLTKPVRHLQVITGVGKHSQGNPVLPGLVRNFLEKNNYHFEEIRPGALKVHPQFHFS
ncbi:smr domain-containing protein C11H11.03c-like [Lotus japonicus]|uniref:smr domain-containing protein C11H11.03c-like n=1 Tax=Lotus japonicus TaxID=34305 RepID=UPI00258788B4|nr:smr domain-containing protein C11H11.03c-like [Lotus japonicus]